MQKLVFYLILQKIISMKNFKYLALFAFMLVCFTSCRFYENGNKDVLPAREGHEEMAHETKVNEKDANEETMTATPAEESNKTVVNLDESGNYIYRVGAIKEITLPDGTVLNVGENSTESKLFNMLVDANFKVSSDKTQNWVTLDRVYFKTGSDQLTDTSKKQLENINSILKAFPNAKVKFGGYTDNTGSQKINESLSEGRAKSVKNDLVSLGITGDRMDAEGYGSQFPLCPANDTPECKAKNRRVDVRIIQK